MRSRLKNWQVLILAKIQELQTSFTYLQNSYTSLEQKYTSLEQKYTSLEQKYTSLEQKYEYRYHKLLQIDFLHGQSLKPVLQTLGCDPFPAKKVERIGSSYDGGYFLPTLDYSNHVLVSIGIGNNMDFEIEATKKFQKVICVDGQMENQISSRVENPKMIFVNENVGNHDAMLSLNELLEIANSRNLVLKCDAEGAELDFLKSIDFSIFTSTIIEIHGLLSEDVNNHLPLIQNLISRIRQSHKIISLTGNNAGKYGLLENTWVPDVFEIVTISNVLYDKIDINPTDFVNIDGLISPNDPTQPNPFVIFPSNFDQNSVRY